MRFRLFISFFLTIPSVVSAQSVSGDSLLAIERSIDRPVTVHARQLRVSGGYSLDLLTRRYNLYRESLSLDDEGTSSVRHRFVADIKYGINEFVQLNSVIGYGANVVRKETMYIYPAEPDPVVAHDVVDKHSGFEDLYVGLDVRAPLKTRKLDIAITLGASLPVAPYRPPVPEHSFQSTQDEGSTTHQYIYRYTYPRGDGVTVARLGAIAKYRTQRWAFSSRVDYRHGLQDGENFEWRHQMDSEGTFEYRKEMFTYRLPDSFTYFAEAEYQPRPRLDIFLNVSGHVAYRGWIAQQENLKVAVPYQNSWVITPGVELILTPRVWLRERINIPVTGRSYEAPFSFETVIMYNLFPFE